MEFKAHPRTIRDALTLPRRYVIPRFQREYSWEAEELEELWDDLLDSIKIENNMLVASEYFIGSLVLVGDDDDTRNIDRQVVDGQQRLMTFTVAFSVLSQLFKKIEEEKLSEIVHNYIIGEDENGKAYTKVVSETPKPFFQYRIQRKDIDFTQLPKTKEEERILAAYVFFENKLEQKNILKELAARFPGQELSYGDALKLFRDHGITNYKIYKDDGYSGTNFKRPGFQEMLAGIEAGIIGTVIVKDMSRFGRNYLEVGLYTELHLTRAQTAYRI